MWHLITFVLIWAMAPGPVVTMTFQETRKNGRAAGIAVDADATVNALLLVALGILVHSASLSKIMASGQSVWLQSAGVLGIILIGLYSGYKSLISVGRKKETLPESPSNQAGFIQGMLLMATHVPQILLFYNFMLPETVGIDNAMTTILALGREENLKDL